MLMTPQMRFISPLAHSGGLLNIIGNLGMTAYMISLMHLLFRIPLLRKLLLPLAAVGVSGGTVYVAHVIIASVALADFSGLSPYNPPSFNSTSPKDGNHLSLIYREQLFFLLFCPIYLRFVSLMPVEKSLVRLNALFVQGFRGL